MVASKFSNVCIESYAVNVPPNEVTSTALEDRLAKIYERLEIPFGTLEKISGMKSRFFWDRKVMPSQAATVAAERALENLPFDRSLIKALFSCSVCRDYFEPATATLVHGNLGLDEDAMTFDISNACIGFSNGMVTLANLIELGVVKAGMVVTGENVAGVVDSTLDYLLKREDSITRENFLRVLPTFTLGSGAAAMVLCHKSIATKGHSLLASVTRSATEHSKLCVGNADFAMSNDAALTPIMETDSQKLIAEGTRLGARTWKEFSQFLEWTPDSFDHVCCHQVGRQLGAQFYREMGLSNEKEYVVYPRYGNQVSAALPTCLISAVEARPIKSGDKVLLTAFGSGINATFTALKW